MWFELLIDRTIMYSFSHNAMVNNGLDGNLDKLNSLQKLPFLIIYHLFNTTGSLKRVAISKGLSFISKKQRGWKGLVKKINALTLTLKLIQRHSNPLIKPLICWMKYDDRTINRTYKRKKIYSKQWFHAEIFGKPWPSSNKFGSRSLHIFFHVFIMSTHWEMYGLNRTNRRKNILQKKKFN